MRKLLIVLLAILLFACSNQQQKEFLAYEHIPASAEIILISKDPSKLAEDLDRNTFLAKSDFKLKNNLARQFEDLKILELKQETALAFSNLSTLTPIYTLITSKDSSLISLDSIKDKSIETITEGDLEFKRIKVKGNTFFLLETENSAIVSNSRQKIIDSQNRDKILNSEDFNKALNASDPDKTSIFFNHSKLPKDWLKTGKISFLPNLKMFANWSVVDLDITNSEIRLNGISIAKKSDKKAHKISKLKPQTSEIAQICPADFVSFNTVSLLGFEEYKTVQDSEKRDSIKKSYPEILNYAREAGNVNIIDGQALIININEVESVREFLAGLGEETESYRDISIFKLNESLDFKTALTDILDTANAEFYFLQDHFLVLSSNPEVLKKIVSSYLNSETLANKSYFTDLTNSLSSESTLLMVSNVTNLSKLTNAETSSAKLHLNKNSLAALQMISEGNYAHLHAVFSNAEEAASVNGVEQSLSIKLDTPIISKPTFFKNHRTDQMDIAVQDENNELYLISNKGNIFWKQQLDSQITSELYQADLFKNGNKQLAFSTSYQMEVLDRKGKKVQGFPIKFNQPLTQPLAVFDYDNNRTYRFVLTQNRKVYMVGPKGKAIKGFNFENAASKVIHPPKHIRLGTKDYILIAEESGKLNILSRQGSIRVPVDEKLDFSTNHWFGYQNSFVSTAPQNNLIKISQNGTVRTTDLKLAENNRIVASRNDLVYLNENELNINSNKVDLDFGLYTNPQLFNIRNKTLIAITDTQTQKVYLFNEKAELLEGFPVYGTSQVDIANADLDSKLELAVRGEDHEILIYEF